MIKKIVIWFITLLYNLRISKMPEEGQVYFNNIGEIKFNNEIIATIKKGRICH